MSARTENCKRRVFCDEPAYKCLTSCAMFEEFPVDAKEENARLQLKAAEEERDRLRDDGVNASKMLVLMAAEIALGRQVSRMNGPGSALTSADIIVEFHKFAARKGHDSD